MIFGAVSNMQHAILLFSKDANNVRALLNNVNVAFMSLAALYFAVVSYGALHSRLLRCNQRAYCGPGIF